MSQSRGSRVRGSVSIRGSVRDGVVVAGDNNTVTKISLPPPETVDIRAELEMVRAILGQLQTAHASDIKEALDAAQAEAVKPRPDKDTIGGHLQRAMSYARGAASFTYVVEKLVPPLRSAAAWLGSNWYDILRFVGLSP